MGQRLKMEEYRKREIDDLAHELDEKRREIFNIRFQQASEKATNPQLMKALRRDVARIRTVLRERELERGKEG
jgi:large subunit ribosomal protein L29